MSESQLWSFSGRTSRSRYFLIGVIAFLLKSNIDRIIATYFFHHRWGVLNYWFPFPGVSSPWQLKGAEANLSLTLLAASLPFIWLGVAQTVRRLRDCEQPLWLSVMFFIPFANLLFFGVLCCWPSEEGSQQLRTGTSIEARSAGFWHRVSDPEQLAAAILATIAASVVGFLLVLLGTQFQGNYGWSLFLAVPFCLGLFSVLILSYRAPRTMGECLMVSIAPVVLIGLALLLLAFEGVICILMAAPLALGISAIAGVMGYWIQVTRWSGRPITMGIVLVMMPFVMGVDKKVQGEPPLLVVHSSIDIEAPPEVVWGKVVTITEIPEPRGWLFHTGIAYPLRATMIGTGVGAVRRCQFTTGAFVEPIQVWDAPRLLRFGVTENPAPLEELTPYHHIEPPHLKGYFVSHEGQFELTRLWGNRTRLTGTTWYTDRIWPSAYWQLWSDYIVHRIHMRVLRHIQIEAESASRAGNH